MEHSSDHLKKNFRRIPFDISFSNEGLQAASGGGCGISFVFLYYNDIICLISLFSFFFYQNPRNHLDL